MPAMSSSVAAAAGLLLLAGLASGQSAEPAIFIVNNVSDGITAFTQNADGTLDLVDVFATSDGPMAATLSDDGRYLAVTHGTIDDVVEVLQIFEIGVDAALSLVLQTTVPDSPLDAAWLNDRFLAVTQTKIGGANAVRVYAFDETGPSLTEIDSGATGSFNANILRHPVLDVLYAGDSGGNRLYWFGWDPATGELDPGGSPSTGGLFPLRMASTSDGAWLYAACGISGSGQNVLGFDTGATGAPVPLTGSPFVSPGASPAYLAVSSDDRFAYVGHGTDATIHAHAIGSDGSLTPIGFSFDIGLQGTIGDVEVRDQYLLVTDESTAIDGVAGLYVFLIQKDGTFTAVAPIEDTGGVRPEAIATWTPVTCPADLDGDGQVGFGDLTTLLGEWGPCPVPCAGDLDGDGMVGFTDLTSLLGDWGQCT